MVQFNKNIDFKDIFSTEVETVPHNKLVPLIWSGLFICGIVSDEITSRQYYNERATMGAMALSEYKVVEEKSKRPV